MSGRKCLHIAYLYCFTRMSVSILCNCFLKKSSAPSHFSSWSRMMPAKATLTPGICLSIKNSRPVLALVTLLRRESLRLQHHHSHSTRNRNLGNRLNQRVCCRWCQNLQWFEMIWTLKTCFLMVCLSISKHEVRTQHAMSSKPLESAVQYLYCRTWYETRTYKLQEKLGVIWRCILLKPTGKLSQRRKIPPTSLSMPEDNAWNVEIVPLVVTGLQKGLWNKSTPLCT